MFGDHAFSILATIATIRIMAWLTPGANMLAVMSASVSNGVTQGILTGLGIAFGGFVWACLAVFGIATVFELFPQLILALRIAGAVYLLWLGFKNLKSAKNSNLGPLKAVETNRTGLGAFRSGFFVTITNPKAALFYGSIFTAFVPADAPLPLLAAIVTMSGLIGVVTYSITAAFFSLKPIVRAFRIANRPISASIGILFCGLGIKVAYDAFRSIQELV